MGEFSKEMADIPHKRGGVCVELLLMDGLGHTVDTRPLNCEGSGPKMQLVRQMKHQTSNFMWHNHC